MKSTHDSLVDIYKAPAGLLHEICRKYFGLSRDEALKQAARGELPRLSFRATESQKASVLVYRTDLADLLDKQAARSPVRW